METKEIGTQDHLLTTESAAAFLSVSKALLIKWRFYGGGPRFVKLGRAVRYRISDLEDFIASHSRISTSEEVNNVG